MLSGREARSRVGDLSLADLLDLRDLLDLEEVLAARWRGEEVVRKEEKLRRRPPRR